MDGGQNNAESQTEHGARLGRFGLEYAFDLKLETPPWPEPQPLIRQTTSDPYPIGVLPRGIRTAVEEVVEFVRCPMALAACSALSTLSVVGQGLADVRRDSGLVGPSSLYLLAIADSGERKTACDKHFTKPIRDWEKKQAEIFMPRREIYAADMRAWEAKCAGLTQAIQSATKSNKPSAEHEEELRKLETEKPKRPRIPQLMHSDATPEALAWFLHTDWHSGGVMSSEAGIVFGGHGMNQESAMRNLALLNNLWEGGDHKVERRTAESYYLRGARLTMGLAVQPGTVRAFFANTKGMARNTGFAARFLIAWPESTQGTRFFRDAPETWPKLSKLHRRLRELLDTEVRMNDNGELSPHILGLEPEAKRVWVGFHDDIERMLADGGGMEEVRDAASKTADNAARIAALFHLYEHGLNGHIHADHVSAGAQIAFWHLCESRRFLDWIGDIALPQAWANAVKLAGWLHNYCRKHETRSVTKRTIQHDGPGAVRSKAMLDPALAVLLHANRVRWTNGSGGSIEINPALLEK